MAYEDTKWRQVPKPVPTPLFDEWKQCPRCNSSVTEVRLSFTEGTRIAFLRTPHLLKVHFYCLHCNHRSEVRSTTFEEGEDNG